MSKQIKAPEKSSQVQKQTDFPLDKYIFRAGTYGLAGFGVGLAASLFFKHKAAVTALCTGAGAGYGVHGLTEDWQGYQRHKGWMDTQTKSQMPQRLRGDDDDDSKDKDKDKNKNDKDLDSFNFDKYAKAQKEHEWTQQKKDDFKSNQQRNEQKRDDNFGQKPDEKQKYNDLFSKLQGKFDQEKADNQRQKRDQQQQDRDSSSKFERKPEQEKADNQRQKRDQQEKDKNSNSKSERQDQQNKQQNQQFKRQAQNEKEEPLNREAQFKKDIADRQEDDSGKPAEEQGAKMGKGFNFNPNTQDKRKREEDALYSQSMQGGDPNMDEIQRGERGPQNPKIPPSQRDWTGGHANKGVLPGQVHRGTPEGDRLGKSVKPDTEPNKNPDQGVPKQGNQALSNVDFKGQKLQTFESNPLPLGKAGPTHEIQKNYQQGRNRADDPDLDNTRRRIAGLEQDRLGKSVKSGILFTQTEKSDTEAGVHNYRPVAEKNLKNQVNAVIE